MKKIKRRVLKKLQKSEDRQESLKYITNTIGRGPNRVLKLLKIINQSEKVKTINQELDIKRNLIE